MDAIDLANGSEEPGFPVELAGAAQNSSEQQFQATNELQRPGLLLMEGVVYAGFGSDCDITPYQGWIFGVSTTGAIKARWVAQSKYSVSGIWQSGAGLTSDKPGNILISTGNGDTPEGPTPGTTPPGNLAESILRLQVQPDGSLKATDFFAPFDAEVLSSWDADFGSGGVTGLPEAYFGTPSIPHLAVAVGKDGYVYLLNRDNLGGIGEGPSGSDNVVQRIGPYGGVWSRPGVWPGEGGWVYIPTASGGTSASGSSREPAGLQVRPLRHRRPRALAAGNLLRSVRLLLERPGHHLRRHQERLGAGMDGVGSQRLRERCATARL